jgi:hypothetical protein
MEWRNRLAPAGRHRVEQRAQGLQRSVRWGRDTVEGRNFEALHVPFSAASSRASGRNHQHACLRGAASCAAMYWRPVFADRARHLHPVKSFSVGAPPTGPFWWDNLENTPWSSMERPARVGQDKSLIFLVPDSPPLGTIPSTHSLSVVRFRGAVAGVAGLRWRSLRGVQPRIIGRQSVGLETTP